jgi:hypothetical protein
MSPVKATLGMVVVSLFLTACWRTDPLYCDSTTSCAAGLEYCDLEGAFPSSQGIRRTCIDAPQSLSVIVRGAGRVSSETIGPETIACGDRCTARFDVGTRIKLVAAPDDSSVFARWEGDCVGSSPTCELTSDRPMNVTAVFSTPVRVDISLVGDGAGIVSSPDGAVQCAAPACVLTLPAGMAMHLSAAASGESGFDGWEGACSGQHDHCTFTVEAGAQVSAAFRNPWTQTWNGQERREDRAGAVGVLRDGTVVVVGNTNSTFTGTSAGLSLRYTRDGRLLGGGQLADCPQCLLHHVIPTSDGGYASGGQVPVGTERQWVLVKYSSVHSFQWKRSYGAEFTKGALLMAMATIGSETIIAAGEEIPTILDHRARIRAYDLAGQLLWSPTLGPGSVDHVAVANDGVVHLSGQRSWGDPGRYYVGSVSPSGIPTEGREGSGGAPRLVGNGTDIVHLDYRDGKLLASGHDGGRRWEADGQYPVGACMDRLGNIATIADAPGPVSAVVMTRYSPTGAILWSRTEDGIAYGAVACDDDLNTVFAGDRSGQGGEDRYDVWVRKYYN